MQALRNKISSKKNKNRNSVNQSVPKFVEERTETVSVTDQSGADVTTTTTTTLKESFSSPVASSSSSSIPIPPPMPSSDFWKSGTPSDYNAYFLEEYYAPSASRKTYEVLPVQHIEKPAVIHEEIRSEQIEEIQPVVQVEREKTEIHQITQPLIDREIKSVHIEERLLPTEILPTIQTESTSVRLADDQSTTVVEQTVRQVVEKQPIVKETEKWRIIEEVQPVIYRETIIPHVIKVTRPMREVVVEQPLFMETTLQRREMYGWEREKYASYMDMSVPRSDLFQKEILIMSKDLGTKVVPVTRVELPAPQQHVNITKETMSSTTVTQQVMETRNAKSGFNMRSSAPSLRSSGPTVVKQTHFEENKVNGDKIVRDSITTQSNVLPTKAI